MATVTFAAVHNHGGRIVKNTGDGLLAELTVERLALPTGATVLDLAAAPARRRSRQLLR